MAGLGYDMVLGNTFHLFLDPGPELVAAARGSARLHALDAPIITDSGGFQVFSMGHGTVADEIKGRVPRGADRAARSLAIGEDGRALPLLRRRLRALHGARRPRWRCRRRWARTSRWSSTSARRSTSRASTPPLDRAHPPLAASAAWPGTPARPEGQAVYGIVQGGVYEDLRRASAQAVAARGWPGSRSAARSARDKAQMYEVVGLDDGGAAGDRPRHLLGIGDVDDLIRGVELGIDTFDCAMPTRLGRHGMALVPEPERRWRIDLATARFRETDEPILAGCPCPACAAGYSRAYLHHLVRAAS